MEPVTPAMKTVPMIPMMKTMSVIPMMKTVMLELRKPGQYLLEKITPMMRALNMKTP